MSGFKITELWAWVSVDPEDGDEGIPAFLDIHGAWMPMIMADRDRIKGLRKQAEQMAKLTPNPLQLRKFSVMTVEDEIPGTKP